MARSTIPVEARCGSNATLTTARDPSSNDTTTGGSAAATGGSVATSTVTAPRARPGWPCTPSHSSTADLLAASPVTESTSTTWSASASSPGRTAAASSAPTSTTTTFSSPTAAAATRVQRRVRIHRPHRGPMRKRAGAPRRGRGQQPRGQTPRVRGGIHHCDPIRVLRGQREPEQHRRCRGPDVFSQRRDDDPTRPLPGAGGPDPAPHRFGPTHSRNVLGRAVSDTGHRARVSTSPGPCCRPPLPRTRRGSHSCPARAGTHSHHTPRWASDDAEAAMGRFVRSGVAQRTDRC